MIPDTECDQALRQLCAKWGTPIEEQSPHSIDIVLWADSLITRLEESIQQRDAKIKELQKQIVDLQTVPKGTHRLETPDQESP